MDAYDYIDKTTVSIARQDISALSLETLLNDLEAAAKDNGALIMACEIHVSYPGLFDRIYGNCQTILGIRTEIERRVNHDRLE